MAGARVETKVTASALAGAAAGVVLDVLQRQVFHGATVPEAYQSLIYLAVPGVLSLAAGWLAPHTNRPAVAPVIVTQTTASTNVQPLPPPPPHPSQPPANGGAPADYEG